MKTKISQLLTSLIFCAVSLVGMSTVWASACFISHESHVISNGFEASAGGVPNYNQHDFRGQNDCGPNAAAMLIGYWDANGYPCLIPGSPYYDSSEIELNHYQHGAAYEAPDRIRHLVDEFKEQTHYTNVLGTAPALIFPIGDDVAAIAEQRGGGAGWDYNEDDNISMENIKRHINEDRPLLMAIRAAFSGGDYETYYGDQAMGHYGDTHWHWMTMFGYDETVEGTSTVFGCVDWMNYDEVFLRLRLGAVTGTNHNIRYHMGAFDDLYTVDVTPSFPPATCVDPLDEDGDGHGHTNPGIGMTPGDDCDDSNAHIYAGAPELCDGLDNDCDGNADEGPDSDNDGIPNICEADDDNDGIIDKYDNCPEVRNADQADYNHDRIGDACQCRNISAGVLSQRIRGGICPPPARRANPVRYAPRIRRFFR